MMNMNTPTITIMGRPNVGKSSLFNAFMKKRKALVHDEAGVTRDRLEGHLEWKGHPFRILDTGGIGEGPFEQEIAAQVDIALEQTDFILLVLDRQTGVTEEDRFVLNYLRKKGIDSKTHKIAMIVNKIDHESHELDATEFYEFGFDPVFFVSAVHKTGIEEIIDWVFSESHYSLIPVESTSDTDPKDDLELNESFSEENETEIESDDEDSKYPKIALVGKPNVGKSTFINALLGQERMLTSDIAGTTVDSIDSIVTLNGKEYCFIDTAGIRRKSKTKQGIEVLSVVQTKAALKRAELAILLIDGKEGPADQDEKIAGLIEDAGCSVIIAVNKWDLQKGNKEFSNKDASEHLRKKMKFLSYAPLLFISAKNKKGYQDLGHLIEDILAQKELKITTPKFTEWVRRQLDMTNPHGLKVFYSHQISSHPPSFHFRVNDPGKMHFSLRRQFVNSIRENWGYQGCPIRIKVSTR